MPPIISESDKAAQDVPADSPAQSGQPVLLHDLMGIAVFHIPGELRPLLGEARFEALMSEIDRHRSCRLIGRTASSIVYVDMPILVNQLPLGALEDFEAEYRRANAADASTSTACAEPEGRTRQDERPAAEGNANA